MEAKTPASPLKINIFMWFLHKNVWLTKNNLAEREWNGSKKYCFCDSGKTNEHLFLSCPFAKTIWHIMFLTYNIPPPTISKICLKVS
jgi:hypothetical protein